MPHTKIVGVTCAALVALFPVTAATAAPPAGGCPSDAWQTSAFPLGWQPGDPMDPNGENLLLQIALAGLIEEFGSMAAGLEAFGFATLEELYAAAVDPGFDKVDHNDDGILCVKPFPEQGGQAAYLANAVDNASHSRH
jgi:hypothetical protein